MKRGFQKFKGYILNLILIWFAFLIYKTLPYYKDFLKQQTIQIIFFIAIIYTIGGLIYYLLIPSTKIKKTKGQLIFNLLKKILQNLQTIISKNKIEKVKIEKSEKIAFLFVLVKIFFLPIMINFVLANFFAIKSQLPKIFQADSFFSIKIFNNLTYPLILAAIFLLDTLWFAFGYATEAGFLKNKIISVEPTFIGWIVALICYPPFNSFFTKYVGWYANDYALFSNDILTFAMRILVILFLGIYVSATFALGTKCSNLTNRGIVSRGPYSIIRHPAYISKNLAWWITFLPAASLTGLIGMCIWSAIYHLRSITEERHLNKDPNYQAYCKKVKYKYIPGVY